MHAVVATTDVSRHAPSGHEHEHGCVGFVFAFHPPVFLGHTWFHGKIVSSHKYLPLILNHLHQHIDIKCTQLNENNRNEYNEIITKPQNSFISFHKFQLFKMIKCTPFTFYVWIIKKRRISCHIVPCCEFN